MSATPFSAFCPLCQARRTFNLDENLDVPRCVVCGSLSSPSAWTLEAAPLEPPRRSVVAMNEALSSLDVAIAAVHRAALHDRETLAELASASARMDDELAELRDSVLELSRIVQRVAADLERQGCADGERAAS